MPTLCEINHRLENIIYINLSHHEAFTKHFITGNPLGLLYTVPSSFSSHLSLF